MKEENVQVRVAQYLATNYPSVQFHSDFGSGCKLTKGQAIKQKRQNAGRRGWPDLFIAEPKHIWDTNKSLGVRIGFADDGETQLYSQIVAGLFIELKKDGEKLLVGPRAKNRFLSIDGKEYKTEHLKEQADVIYKLNQRGYIAVFAVGFEEAKKLIDEYLGGNDVKDDDCIF